MDKVINADIFIMLGKFIKIHFVEVLQVFDFYMYVCFKQVNSGQVKNNYSPHCLITMNIGNCIRRGAGRSQKLHTAVDSCFPANQADPGGPPASLMLFSSCWQKCSALKKSA